MIGLALLAPLSSFAEESGANKKKPNIIYILADDLGISELGCYGQQLIETPNIDRLSQEGMTFSNHYSGTAVSAPSRCVLFTGLHTGHAYIRGNDEMASRGDVWNHKAVLADSTLEGQRPVPAETVMIPAVMKQAGYTTACIGKWGLGYPGSASTPNKMGFDFFYGYNCQREAHTYYPPFLYRNEHREYLNNPLVVPHTKLDKGADPYEEKSYAKYTLNEYAPDLMYKEILNFIDLTKDNPFVLFWTTPLPHVPLQAPETWVKHYVNKFGDEKPYTGNKDYFPCRYPRATYAAMMSYWDEQIGGLINKLKELGIYDNTIIIFTSDNGPAPSFKGSRAGNMRGCKASLFEGGIHMPFIIWDTKGEIPSGKTDDTTVVSALDLYKSLSSLAGIKLPADCKSDGMDMSAALKGVPQERREPLFWEYRRKQSIPPACRQRCQSGYCGAVWQVETVG